MIRAFELKNGEILLFEDFNCPLVTVVRDAPWCGDADDLASVHARLSDTIRSARDSIRENANRILVKLSKSYVSTP